jgi:hypothetical protein
MSAVCAQASFATLAQRSALPPGKLALLGSEGESAESRYRARVRARIRRHPGPSSWTSVKNGFTGLMLAVGDDSIVVYAPGLPVRLAQRLGVDYELSASDVSLSTAHLGWMGTALFARECLVLTWSSEGRLTELAVRPQSGDLKRMETALIEAGVQRRPAA